MKMDIRYPSHPNDFMHYNTNDIRRDYLIEQVFVDDQITMVYSHFDRIIAGGAAPVHIPLCLEGGKETASAYFLERRELGVINVGGPGSVTADDQTYCLNARDGIYIGMGTKTVRFESADPQHPARFYFNSAPAHCTYPTRHITIADANPRKLGDSKTCNARTIYQYLHPAVMKTCQLCMGLTALEPGSNWNSMPCHTHERRMEVYFYFDLPEDGVVFHMMGQPDETRHVVMRNEQAVISPSWSIHTGVGTSNYTFIWGMCGENQEFDDMDHVAMSTLK